MAKQPDGKVVARASEHGRRFVRWPTGKSADRPDAKGWNCFIFSSVAAGGLHFVNEVLT